MRSITVVGLGVVLALALGCGQQAATPPADETVSEAPAAVEPVAVEVVEVAPEGTEFEPPVQVAQIPEGAWYCDMGTVHYARLDEGDGKCAVCGMDLTHKVAVDEPAAEGSSDETPSEEGGEHQG